jgi:hypothetical protein
LLGFSDEAVSDCKDFPAISGTRFRRNDQRHDLRKDERKEEKKSYQNFM